MSDSGEQPRGWIPSAEYDFIQARVPILCVDLLPLDDTGRIGLIERDTHGGKRGWCLVGGAVLHNEDLGQAVTRHLQATLGPGVTHKLLAPEPLMVAEYFTVQRPGRLHDPRKHAVALTYAGTITGQVQAQGEAIRFDWFDRDEIDSVAFGFGQDAVVRHVLARLQARPKPA